MNQSRALKSSLRQIKRRFKMIKENLEGLEYWQKERELGVIKLEKRSIKHHFQIIKERVERITTSL